MDRCNDMGKTIKSIRKLGEKVEQQDFYCCSSSPGDHHHL
jgi:hypothetical protein